MKRVLNFLKKKHLYFGISRYLLGIWMFPYAITKIMRTQFVLSGLAWVEPKTFETMQGTQLAWAFLGHSAWFQILLGFLELIPALLLLFRRTALLGAILMLPITLNVFLINYALDLWPATKMVSCILLALNIVVLTFQWNKIKLLVLTILGKDLGGKFTRVEVVVNTVLIVAIGFLAFQPLLKYKGNSNSLTGDWINQHPNEWILQKEQGKDSVLVNRELKLYFGAYGVYNEVGSNTDTGYISYTADTVKRSLDLKYDDGRVVKCRYELLGDSILKMERGIDTLKNNKVIQYFKKRVINGSRPTL